MQSICMTFSRCAPVNCRDFVMLFDSGSPCADLLLVTVATAGHNAFRGVQMKHRKLKFALGVTAVVGGGTAIPWIAGASPLRRGRAHWTLLRRCTTTALTRDHVLTVWWTQKKRMG